jgi:hypothetical protein
MLSQVATSSILTRTRPFKKLAKWAFDACDADDKGRISKDELYAGILLVHIQLAKYVGVAACFPPTRQVCDQLFQASDDDGSGFIDQAEFTQILVICCAQILSRIVVYFTLMILLVPVAAHRVVKGAGLVLDLVQWQAEAETFAVFLWLESLLTLHGLTEKSVSLVLSFLVIPMIFNLIDSHSRRSAEEVCVYRKADNRHKTSTTLEEKSSKAE